MKQKVTISLMILLIAVAVAFMLKDLFQPKVQEKNPFVYDIEEFKSIDSSDVCYRELNRFNPNIANVKAVAIDENDNLFVAGDDKILSYTPDLKRNIEIDISGKVSALHIADDNVIVAFTNHIEIYKLSGEKSSVWNPFNARSVITSVALKDNMLFVADAGNKLLLKYNIEGELLQEIGKKDSINRPKGFVIPSPYFDIALGRNGEIWAVNSGLHQFEAYNQNGELFSSWKRTSMQWDGFSGCCNPSHIAILSDGAFVTSEKGLVRIKIHEPTGNFRCAVALPDEFNEGTRGIDLAVDSKDRIFAIIPNTNEVRVYQRKQALTGRKQK